MLAHHSLRPALNILVQVSRQQLFLLPVYMYIYAAGLGPNHTFLSGLCRPSSDEFDMRGILLYIFIPPFLANKDIYFPSNDDDQCTGGTYIHTLNISKLSTACKRGPTGSSVQ